MHVVVLKKKRLKKRGGGGKGGEGVFMGRTSQVLCHHSVTHGAGNWGLDGGGDVEGGEDQL